MLHGALIKFDKSAFLWQKRCYRNILMVCIVAHVTRGQKWIWVVDKRSFIIYCWFISIVKKFLFQVFAPQFNLN